MNTHKCPDSFFSLNQSIPLVLSLSRLHLNKHVIHIHVCSTHTNVPYSRHSDSIALEYNFLKYTTTPLLSRFAFLLHFRRGHLKQLKLSMRICVNLEFQVSVRIRLSL